MGKGFDIHDKVAFMYFVHFEDKDPCLATCKDCIDYELGLCTGGAKCVMDCMYDKVKNSDFYYTMG